MRILIPIFFNAPMGGLHHHVLASVRAMHAANHEVIVVSKPGPFADAISGLGAAHISTDWSDEGIATLVAQCCATSPDIIYSHPFASRQLAVAVSDALAVPLVAVWHGMYDDFVGHWVGSIDTAVAVSQGVAGYLSERCPPLAEKLVVIPNGVDDVWQRRDALTRDDESVHIGFVCRLDDDKQFILDVFAGAVTNESLSRRDDIVWHIIGDGEKRNSLASEFESAGVPTKIQWHGWLETPAMMEVMAQCDLLIAPGRSALEAMALGRATIAVGSKHYAGIVRPENWEAVASTNFGGIGDRFESYKHGTLAQDLLSLIDDSRARDALARFGADLVDTHFRDAVSQERLLHVLSAALARGKPSIDNMQIAYAQERAVGLRQREDAILTYRRYSQRARESAVKHEAQVARLNEGIARRDAKLEAIKRNPLSVIGMAMGKLLRRGR